MDNRICAAVEATEAIGGDMEQMQSDEQFLQGTWEWMRVRFSDPHEGYSQGVYVVEFPRQKFSHKERDAAITLGAAFTRERLEEARQLREEMAAIENEVDYYANISDIPEQAPIFARIFDRLEAILADKTSGMKAGAF